MLRSSCRLCLPETLRQSLASRGVALQRLLATSAEARSLRASRVSPAVGQDQSPLCGGDAGHQAEALQGDGELSKPAGW